MFFQDFWTWLDARLAAYVSVHAADLAAALTPVAGTLGVLYVMFWGWLHLRGQIEEPFMEGVKLCVREVRGLSGLVVGMDQLLFR